MDKGDQIGDHSRIQRKNILPETWLKEHRPEERDFLETKVWASPNLTEMLEMRLMNLVELSIWKEKHIIIFMVVQLLVSKIYMY